MDKVHFIRRLFYEQGKNIPTIIANVIKLSKSEHNNTTLEIL